jgi:hypothetical protein
MIQKCSRLYVRQRTERFFGEEKTRCARSCEWWSNWWGDERGRAFEGHERLRGAC